MIIAELREELGVDYDDVPEETLQALIELIEVVCGYVIATENQDQH